jgi:hypothetical protein
LHAALQRHLQVHNCWFNSGDFYCVGESKSSWRKKALSQLFFQTTTWCAFLRVLIKQMNAIEAHKVQIANRHPLSVQEETTLGSSVEPPGPTVTFDDKPSVF